MELSAQLAAMEQAFAEKRLEDVINQAKSFIEANPTRLEGYLFAGKAYWAEQKTTDAKYYLIQAQRVDAKSIEVLANLATISLESGDVDVAAYNYDRILQDDPKNVVGLVGKADCDFADGATKYALEGYLAALENGVKEKLPAAQYVIVLYKAGHLLYEEERYEEGFALLEKYTTTEFNEPLVSLKRNFCQMLGESKAAVYAACLEQLHENMPNNPNYILELAQIAAGKGDKATMGKLYTKLIKLEALTADQKKEAYYGRATVFVELGKFAEALSDYNHIIEQEGSWFYFEKRALVKEQLKDYKGALEDITKSLSLQSPPTAASLVIRARFFMAANGIDQAIKDLLHALKIDPKNRDAHFDLGMAYNKKGDGNASFKSLVDAEACGHLKAREMLLSKYPKQLTAVREKTAAGFLAEFEPAFERNARSPILQQAFGKLWLPDMQRIVLSMGDELRRYSKAAITEILDSMAAEMLLVTPQGMLYFEDANAEPVEFYYKVELESEHAILLEAQPTKGGDRFQVRIAFFEGALLFTNPVQDVEVQPNYFKAAEGLTAAQKTRLTTKKIEGSKYLAAIETAIAELTK